MIQTKIEVLKAYYGDCIFVTICYESKDYVIMIDGGLDETYQERRRRKAGPLQEKLNVLKEAGKHIDLLIVTHVDYDHIGGVLKWFETDFPENGFVRRVWINDDVKIADHTDLNNNAAHAASLQKQLAGHHLLHENQIVVGKEEPFEWGKIVVLAPNAADHNKIANKIAANLDNKENTNYMKDIKKLVEEGWEPDGVTPENDASIAILLHTNDGENDLFLGDANIDTVMMAIGNLKDFEKPLHCKWVKLAHHGSKNNFKTEFLKLVDGENYIFSSNGDYYGHPDKEVAAELIDKTKAKLWFNYVERGRSMITNQDKKDYPDVMNRIMEIQ